MKTKSTLMAAGLLVASAFAAHPARAADYCREYTRTVTIGNHAQEAYGTACQQPDGSWQIVSENGGDGEGRSFVLNGNNYDNVVYVEPQVRVPPPRTSIAVGGPGYFFSYNNGASYRPYYYRPAPTRIVFYDYNRGHNNNWNRGHDHDNNGHNHH